MSTYSELLKKYCVDPILLKHVWLGEQYGFYKIQYNSVPQFILADFEGSKSSYSSKYEKNVGKDFSTFVDDRQMKRLHRLYSYYKDYRGDLEFISTLDGMDYWLYYAKIMEEYIIVKKVRIFQQLFDK
uniref:hypothetical protein n=1 Tax=Anaerosporobacter sp. TaxID=1872529 RepID=UPI00286EDDEF